eukprot:TRINITY_DN1930_c3_g1_i1.p1 TRINITY_DN1930_c3_g1~~TRINITY_DN1930_c3_g1_i1.p1  ORF type:complete len:380 (+),score=71.31 TRINITY_DN1930_c3_g1_i1:44-1141(+)
MERVQSSNSSDCADALLQLCCPNSDCASFPEMQQLCVETWDYDRQVCQLMCGDCNTALHQCENCLAFVESLVPDTESANALKNILICRKCGFNTILGSHRKYLMLTAPGELSVPQVALVQHTIDSAQYCTMKQEQLRRVCNSAVQTHETVSCARILTDLLIAPTAFHRTWTTFSETHLHLLIALAALDDDSPASRDLRADVKRFLDQRVQLTTLRQSVRSGVAVLELGHELAASATATTAEAVQQQQQQQQLQPAQQEQLVDAPSLLGAVLQQQHAVRVREFRDTIQPLLQILPRISAQLRLLHAKAAQIVDEHRVSQHPQQQQTESQQHRVCVGQLELDDRLARVREQVALWSACYHTMCELLL